MVRGEIYSPILNTTDTHLLTQDPNRVNKVAT